MGELNVVSLEIGDLSGKTRGVRAERTAVYQLRHGLALRQQSLKNLNPIHAMKGRVMVFGFRESLHEIFHPFRVGTQALEASGKIV